MPNRKGSKKSKKVSNKQKGGCGCRKQQRGGMDKKPLMPQKGGVVLPSEYFGGDSGRYFEAGSSELKSCPGQYPVSRGVVHADGKWAGPVLKPQSGAGKKKSKKTNKRKRTKKVNRKVKKTKKTKKSKSRKH